MANMTLTSHFGEIIDLIKQSRTNAIQAVNSELVNLYWNVGAYISHKLKNSDWGDKTVSDLSVCISQYYPDIKGFERRNLYRMIQFYETYQECEFVSPVVTQFYPQDIRSTFLAQISWTHHTIIFSRCKTEMEREFYLKQCIKERYSKRELDRQISSCQFERTMIGKAQLSPSVKALPQNADEIFKDSYIFDFLNLPEPYHEYDLQKGLVNQMKHFILELGKDFLFMGQEYKLMVGNSDFYIDLLFYHRGLQCLVAFELKADKFRPEHLGQLNFYLEALDRDVKRENENPSIGILLCKDKDNEVVEYALNRHLSPTMVAEYKMMLPDKNMLQRKLHELLS